MKFLLKICTVVIILSIPMAVVWETGVSGRVYQCMDEVGLDYLRPGDWVHGDVVMVDDVRAASVRGMEGPDLMLRGWSVGRLWTAWVLMLGSSIAIGWIAAGRKWWRRAGTVHLDMVREAEPTLRQ